MKTKFISISTVGSLVMSLFILQGCIGGAFVAGAATSGVLANDKRKLETMVDDRTIDYNANLRLINDPDLKNKCHIVVSSFNRVALITGQAANETLRDRAVQQIQSIPQIKRVYNEITISPPTSTLARSNDSWITTKVRSQMVLVKDFQSNHIKVVTENGTVYLLGLVTPKQGRIAAQVARQITGVQRVVKLFEYLTVVE